MEWTIGKMFNEEVVLRDGVIWFSMTNKDIVEMLNNREELAEALEGIDDIGKRDMTNPKYDTYFRSGKEALKKWRELNEV